MEVSIPKTWAVSALLELGEWSGGGTPSKAIEDYWTGNIPWVSPKDMKQDAIFDSEDHISESAVRNSATKLIPSNSLLFVTRSGILAHTFPVAIAMVPVTVNQDIKALTPSDGIDAKFLAWLLRSKERQIIQTCSKDGTTVASIETSRLHALSVPIAPTNEQRRIVAKIEELFSELDKGIESLKTAQAQLKVYRQALLKHAFEGKLTTQWRADNPDKLETADALLERIQREREQRYQQHLADWEAAGKQGSKPKAPKPLAPLTAEELAGLPELPNGWAWSRVASVCDVVRGGSPRPAGDPKFYGGNIPFLKVADITHTDTPYLNSFTFTITDAGLSKTRKIEPNTLLLSNSGATLGVPKICLISATMNDGVAAFLGLPTASLLYHYYFWQSKTAQLRNIDQGAAQPNLNTDLIKDTFIPLCFPSEQVAVAQELEAKLSEVDRLDQVVTTSLQQAEALRQSILKKAFSGRLVSQDASDESASILLARIKAEKTQHLQRGRPRKLQAVPVQPVPDKGKVLVFPARIAGISATDLHAGVLAMAYRLHEQDPKRVVYFGHVKAEKISHLVESHLGVDLERMPFKDAAGPNDYPHLKKVESRARKANWFDVRQQKAGGAYVFSRKPGFDALLDKTANALGGRLAEVDALLQILLPLNTRQAEIVATLYAAWNNLLLAGRAAGDEEIVYEARENWHQAKLDIEREKFFQGLEWMRKQGLVPVGRGRYVAEKGKPSKAGRVKA